MPPCKNDITKTYKGTEPSPKGLGYCAHAEDVGKIMTGKDKNMWIITETSQKVKRWSKLKDKCSYFVEYESQHPSKRYVGLEFRKGYIHKFISYNLFEEKERKIPESYKNYYISRNKKKISITKSSKKRIEEHYCGSLKILKEDNKEYLEIKNKLKGYKTYFILSYFTRYYKPYLVYVKDNDVYIYTFPINVFCHIYSNIDNRYNYIELVKHYNTENVFIGKMNGDPTVDGNTILLYLGGSKYIFIGSDIYEFNIPTNDKIIKYYSITKNEAPDPIAVGIKNVYSFITYNSVEYLPIDIFPKKMNNKDWENATIPYFEEKYEKEEYKKKLEIKIIRNIEL